MTIKTFRGLIADGSQDTIVLHTNDGSTGYRIVKFQIFPWRPGEADSEHVLKIYKISQSTIDHVVDFSDNTLLAAAYYQDDVSEQLVSSLDVVFDQEIFNQDIYVTSKALIESNPTNYYIELEQIKLDLSENTVATLKDIRNAARIPLG